MKKQMYEQTDRFRRRLKEFLKKEVNHLCTLSFDELNVIGTKEATSASFKRLRKMTDTEYPKIAKAGRKFAESYLNEDEILMVDKKNFDPFEIVESVLSSYNLITGYLYKKELERKRLRLNEEILTAREYMDKSRMRQSVTRTGSLLFTQLGQYAIDIEDKSVIDVWKKANIKKVRWITEKDEKVCDYCKPLDNQVFDIDNVPEKSHYNCRCYLIPVRDETKTEKS